ncbi:MAG: Asp-tRNA(Asn)/Glu-tRNA(Gln) amidotransferase subunit GatB [Candidatus Adlerbacteria bacterium]|nr:Asp-tRNA(Asn)/Glu-tRNA(Gln) amidotransferase subunit GatB [Candidatus Adlerbacteria bacterium]
MSEYRPTIGLEIHAELNTHTKMFCGCLNNADEKGPNVNICPVCMAHPGTLPVINKAAVSHVLRMGVALGSKLADYTEFDRKSYFYPDIPKGYQISQFAYPLVQGGSLKGIEITRIHLEEDTARSQHVGETSLVDFNRAGVPLMELVTEPVIHTAEDAGAFARELQLLLRYLGASEANMEKGEMRVEANISVSKTDTFGTKVEVKNLNSFRSVERAIAFEIARQVEVLEGGGQVVQETRGWNEGNQTTFSQRKKESSHDYRYFPDPDLPKLVLSELPEFSTDSITKELPELPWQKRERLKSLGFLQEQDIEQLVGDFELSVLFTEIEKKLTQPELLKIAANFILNDIAGQRKKKPEWLPRAELIIEVVEKYAEGKLASPQAKASILAGTLVATIDESTLPALVQKIVDANPAVVAEYRAGKEAVLQFLVGQGMKETKGSANPGTLAEEFKKALK